MIPNKALFSLVIGMAVVIVVMLGMVAYGIMQRAEEASSGFLANPAAGAATATGTMAAGPDLTVQIAQGSSVVSVDRDGGLIMAHVVDEDDRSMLLFIDPADGRIVRRILFSARAPGTR